MPKDKPPMLWHSNAPWSRTGYGQQTAMFAPKLKEHFDLTLSAFYGLEGNVLPWNGTPVLPGVGGTYGNECIAEHVRTAFGEADAGLIVTLMDVWVLDPGLWSQFNVASWVPVDHEPVPDPVLRFFLESGAVPIAMSKFGQNELAKGGVDPLYMPHGVDTKVYKPVENPRENTGLPEDDFVVGMVAANKGNPSRKCFQEAFEAFNALRANHKDARLYLHTEMTGRFQGVDLRQLMAAVGVPPESVSFCDQYRAVHYPFDDQQMAEIYSSMDVLLMPSAGEGFGIPAIEAQACGVPIIASDFSAQKELTGSGWLVDGTKHFTPIGSWQFRPDVKDIYDALKQAYLARGNEELSEKARKFALDYDADKVFRDFMLPALEEAADRFKQREPAELKVAA